MIVLFNRDDHQRLREAYPQYVEPPLPLWGRWLVFGLCIGSAAMACGFFWFVCDFLAAFR